MVPCYKQSLSLKCLQNKVSTYNAGDNYRCQQLHESWYLSPLMYRPLGCNKVDTRPDSHINIHSCVIKPCPFTTIILCANVLYNIIMLICST